MPNIPQATRDKLDAKGETMAGGRYPIHNATDLENAYKDYIRTGRPGDVAAWITKRANALGLPNPLKDDGDEMTVARTYNRKRT